jgi:hypothetical protein
MIRVMNRRYFIMGKTKETRYKIANPNSPASSRETYALYSVTGVDVRAIELTKIDASTLIDAAKTGHSRHVRVKLESLGGEVKTNDVHKSHRSDPKPKGYKVLRKNGKSKQVKASTAKPAEQMLSLLKEHPELKAMILTELKAELTASDDSASGSESEPKPKTQKKSTRTKSNGNGKASGSKAGSKQSAPKVAEDVDIDDLLAGVGMATE